MIVSELCERGNRRGLDENEQERKNIYVEIENGGCKTGRGSRVRDSYVNSVHCSTNVEKV